MVLLQMMTAIATILPDPPSGSSPAEIAQHGIDFFNQWIERVGGIVAFIGAIKFALSIKSDDAREQIQAILVMVSGFMIISAVNDMDFFSLSCGDTETIFQNIMSFIGKWTRRVGALATMLGAIMFGFAIKDENAGNKINGLKTFAAGAICVSVSAILPLFVS